MNCAVGSDLWSRRSDQSFFEVLTSKFALVNKIDSEAPDMGPHFVDGIGLLTISPRPSAHRHPNILLRRMVIHPPTHNLTSSSSSAEIVGSTVHGCLSVVSAVLCQVEVSATS